MIRHVSRIHTPLRLLTSLGLLLGLVAPLAQPPVASAAPGMLATFVGGTGTLGDSPLYARQNGALTLNVSANSDTRCVTVNGDHSARQTSSTAKSSWTFSFAAGAGNGVKSVVVLAYPRLNTNGSCAGTSSSASAAYILDNAGPLVSATLSPAANSAGWHKASVAITWSAVDSGVGLASGPTPSSDSVTTNGIVERSATATDRLGNSGSGSVTVKLDTLSPTITGSRVPAANAFGWNNTDVAVSFTCADTFSGIQSCTDTTLLSNQGANQSATGTAVDNAGNSASTTVSPISIDKTPPTLSGAATTSPNSAGWYNDDVTIHWTAADALSGLDPATLPGDSLIGGEGAGLTASTLVRDKAGNTTSATSDDVNIDRTPPVTTVTAAPEWNNTDLTVNLSADDNLSGIKATYFTIDGGAQQTGNSVHFGVEGVYTLRFWSQDRAGNLETPRTAEIKIDKTPPTIRHTQSPAANANGWNNTDVTITFICADGFSGIRSCTGPQTVTTEGQSQTVIGTAVDNAGNRATDPASVSIDKTPPTISAAPDRAANSYGWYSADVTVAFDCADALSGIAQCPASQTLGEGAAQQAQGEAADAADNTASAIVSGINVDKTPPTFAGATTTAPNANGWYRGDVVVQWTCADALSGIVGACPANTTLTGEGDNLAASAVVRDKAGHTTAATLDQIRIDRTPPSTRVSVPAPLESGWYAAGVRVTLIGSDALSGVATTYYSVDGGPAQVYSGAFDHGLSGVHQITFWSVDRAGNIEDRTAPGHTITLKLDPNAPTIIGSRTPAANTFGWNNTEVAVSFTCSDADSGIAGCTGDTVLTNEGTQQSVTGVAIDNAGNSAQALVGDINIDLTAPDLSGAPTTSANAAGWYRGDVSVHWVAADGLSGIDPATLPADSVITGEGANLAAGPVSVADKAGNSGGGSLGGIKIDRTPPTIAGAVINDDGTPRTPNAAGWYNSAVRVGFTCSDVLSGIASCASDGVINSDGVGQSASGSASDVAGNSASTTVGGINIDSQPPQTTADIVCTSVNSWCHGDSATVTLSAVDQSGLSGVKEIHYRINGGTEQIVSGASASIVVPLATQSGTASIQFFAVDRAGNRETLSGASLTYDNLAPTVSHTLTPMPNAAGWNRANTTVHFSAVDDIGGSGVNPGTLTPDQTITVETAGVIVNGQAEDYAGNRGTDSVLVKLDKTAPTIGGAATTSPNANGWYNTAVTVRFTCADTLSGVATCPDQRVLTSNGANQSVSGTAADYAGNTASRTVGGINIDTIAPTITIQNVSDSGIYTLGAVPTPTCSATDSGSGLVGPCQGTLSGGTSNGVGTYTYTATATDRAGNVQTKSISYRVVYQWNFFLQPINDTAHDVGANTSIFKAGSTVPVKFRLTDANGTPVAATSQPIWLTPVKGSPMTEPVDESVYSDPASSGSFYRGDGTGLYIYNWGTDRTQANYYWRIGVKLDDNQVYFVNIGLR